METRLREAPGLAAWRHALADKSLHDLPYKVETNEREQIVLSPHKRSHSDVQGELIRLLYHHLSGGYARPEYPVQTRKGVKMCDVVWMSPARYAEAKAEEDASLVAPEICIEVRSASNTQAEMDEKRALYFERGAEEVWVVSADGKITFYTEKGRAEASARVPDFPSAIEI